MTANELIAALSDLPAEQRDLPLIGHDRFDAYGDVVAVRTAELESGDTTRRPCLYVVVKELGTFEWVVPDPGTFEKPKTESAHD